MDAILAGAAPFPERGHVSGAARQAVTDSRPRLTAGGMSGENGAPGTKTVYVRPSDAFGIGGGEENITSPFGGEEGGGGRGNVLGGIGGSSGSRQVRNVVKSRRDTTLCFALSNFSVYLLFFNAGHVRS